MQVGFRTGAPRKEDEPEVREQLLDAGADSGRLERALPRRRCLAASEQLLTHTRPLTERRLVDNAVRRAVVIQGGTSVLLAEIVDRREPGGAPARGRLRGLGTVNSLALALVYERPEVFAAEATGGRIPLLMLPSVNSALAAHQQFEGSVETLRGAGVRVLHGEGDSVPKVPKEINRAAYP